MNFLLLVLMAQQFGILSTECFNLLLGILALAKQQLLLPLICLQFLLSVTITCTQQFHGQQRQITAVPVLCINTFLSF